MRLRRRSFSGRSMERPETSRRFAGRALQRAGRLRARDPRARAPRRSYIGPNGCARDADVIHAMWAHITICVYIYIYIACGGCSRRTWGILGWRATHGGNTSGQCVWAIRVGNSWRWEQCANLEIIAPRRQRSIHQSSNLWRCSARCQRSPEWIGKALQRQPL